MITTKNKSHINTLFVHINNCFKDNELEQSSVVKESLTTAKDGKRYLTKFYNIDVGK